MGNRFPPTVAGSMRVGASAASGATNPNLLRAQETPSAPLLIATPFSGETAFALVGRSTYLDLSITAYGYFTAVAGIDRSMVFSPNGSVSAATARFTYYAQLDQSDQPLPGDVLILDALGTLTVYFTEDGGADMGTPSSFFAGTPIATMQARVQEVLLRTDPDSGIIVSEGTLGQLWDASFVLDGEPLQFGHVGLQERFLLTGTTVVDEQGNTPLMASIAGHATVTGRDVSDEEVEATPQSSSAESVPAGTATVVGDQPQVEPGCEGVESWFTGAMASAERAQTIVADIVETASVQSLDAAVVGDAATELSELAETQRSAVVPEIGRSANGLLVTALSTLSQGASLAESAVLNRDDAALAQAVDLLQDGEELISRALEQITQVGTMCGVQA